MEIHLTESSNPLYIGVGICLHIDTSSFALGVMNLHNAMDLELDVVTEGAQVRYIPVLARYWLLVIPGRQGIFFKNHL
jgi:hypothetical protein